jgi:EAL domain-containing protein (putative c-di-GMP-specific phosphodiesterase class I)
VNGTREQQSDFSNLVRWNDQARRLGLQTLLTDVADSQTLNAAISQGYELVEGPVLMALSKGGPVAARRVGQLPLQAHDTPLTDWML